MVVHVQLAKKIVIKILMMMMSFFTCIGFCKCHCHITFLRNKHWDNEAQVERDGAKVWITLQSIQHILFFLQYRIWCITVVLNTVVLIWISFYCLSFHSINRIFCNYLLKVTTACSLLILGTI